MKRGAMLIQVLKEALRSVIDPELGYNVVDLGFIYDIVLDGRTAQITMTVTTPGCPAAAFLKEGVAARALAVPGVGAVDVTLTFDPKWAPSMMSAAAKAELGFAQIH